MNYLKRTALILLLFIIIGLIVSIFLPSTFKMERNIVIDADKEQVFKQINDLKNWKNWSPWAVQDPLIYENDAAYSNPSFGKGATFEWDSELENLGSGHLKIIDSKNNQSIKSQVNFGYVEAIGEFNLTEKQEGIEVVWSINIDFGFNPISKFFGLFLEEKMAPNYELGLSRLKAFTENLPKIHKVEVKKELLKQDLWFLSIRDSINQQEMNNVHGKILAKINQYLDEKEVEFESKPLVIYHFWSDTLVDIEVGIPVQDSTLIGNDEIKLNKISATNVVTAIHYGPYERLPETYFGINEWMRKNKVIVTGPPWESYITDPAAENDPEKWQTAIFFPIE